MSEEGLLDEAEQLLHEAISLHDRPLYWARLASVFQDRGDHEETVRILSEVCRRESRPAYHGLLACSLSDLGRHQEAIEAIRGIPATQRETQHWNVLGISQYALGMHTESCESLREALRQDPGFDEAMYNLAIRLVDDESLDEARQLLTSAIKVDRSRAEYRRELGRVLVLLGDLDGCYESLKVALALDPRDAVTHEYLGHYYLGKIQPDRAEEMYRKALALDSGLDTAAESLVEVLEEQGRDREAGELRRSRGID